MGSSPGRCPRGQHAEGLCPVPSSKTKGGGDTGTGECMSISREQHILVILSLPNQHKE